MGRIKTAKIKRQTLEIVNKYADKLTTSYVENKKILNSLIATQSKKLRNIIAGYATRLMQTRDKI